jgi:hypothetical protein
MAAVALAYPMAWSHNGILYLIGYSAGSQWIRRSADGGRTWLNYSDGRPEREIAVSDPERVAFVKMETQGSRLVVGVPQAPYVRMYVSADDGGTWEGEGEV